TVEAVLQTILSAFRAHKELYFNRGILHRDISINNILHAPPKEGQPATTHGLLIDLDYGLALGVPGTTPSPVHERSGVPHRTGTLPFMAISVLQDSRFPHRYHYDVQSFLFVTLW
ncbi:hypothetical protein BDZ91DRAFT_621264, partial [Kalaharituber pfeilii]